MQIPCIHAVDARRLLYIAWSSPACGHALLSLLADLSKLHDLGSVGFEDKAQLPDYPLHDAMVSPSFHWSSLDSAAFSHAGFGFSLPGSSSLHVYYIVRFAYRCSAWSDRYT